MIDYIWKETIEMKTICFYLPQFYETPENNEWWGKGYTDWKTAKNAKCYSKKQRQPRVPLDDNYYDLVDEDASALKWQAQLAKQYGIYGFCMYHYWFRGRKILEKPIEILRRHKEIETHYSLCWDNGDFTRTWYACHNEQEILIQQDYGDESVWKQHFMDLLPDFQDERYIKIDNKPVFHIYRAHQIECLEEMLACWNRLAEENGFAGVYVIAGDPENRGVVRGADVLDAYYNYEPQHAYHINIHKAYGRKCIFAGGVKKRINALFHTTFLPYIRDAKGIYQCIVKDQDQTPKRTYYGMFADYDDTPRRQERGIVYAGNSIELFKDALQKQIRKSVNAGNEFLYINAWNEWGESAYLEPDSVNGYAYLEAVRDVMQEEGLL